MVLEALWRRYARIWSSEAQARETEIDACLAETCTYCDINGVLEGREALSRYMGQFQESVPGGSFEILSVLAHHSRTIAEWRLRASDGRILQTGRSFARLSADGRLQDITGFFDATPQGEAA